MTDAPKSSGMDPFESTVAINKHLLLDSTIFDIQLDGGISRYWFELLSNLARRRNDWKLTLLADPHTKNKFGKRLIEETRGNSKVRVHEYVPSQIGRLFGPRLPDKYKDFLWHSSYYRLAARPPMSSVCTVHDFIYERYFSGPQARLHAWIKRKAIFQAAEIICVSEATRRDLCRLYPQISDTKCHVVHHGPSLAFRPPQEAIPPTGHASPYILFVGSRAGYKNFPLAVRAVEAVPGHDLVIVGGGKLSKRESALLHQHLPGRHRILDSPTDEVLRDLYREASALAYLSRFEGFGFPPLEAMACGCPVIAMAATSIPEVVGEAAILLPGEDCAAVVEAIRAVLVPERRLDLIEKGLQRASLFSWDRAVDETVAIYERALRGR